MNYLSILIIFTGLFLSEISLISCEIPVFRYALERWPADNYSLIVKAPEKRVLEVNEKSLIDSIKSHLVGEGGHANVTLQVLKVDTDFCSIELHYPQKSAIGRLVWQGLLSEDNVQMIFSSPARKELQKNILNGESITWLIIPSGDKKEDAAFTEKLLSLIPQAAEGLHLSEEIIQMDEADRIDAMSTKKELDNLIRSSVPLRISFETMIIPRDSPQEEVFLKMLLEQSANQSVISEPMAIPLFGRGRTLDAVPASKLTLENLKELTKYLCSGCSCTVKAENPGVDIVMNVPWADYISDTVMTVKELPPLVGVIDAVKIKGTVHEEVDKSTGTLPNSSTLIYLLVIILAGLAVGSVIIMRR